MFALILSQSSPMRLIVLSFGIVASAMGCTQADRFYATGGGAPAPRSETLPDTGHSRDRDRAAEVDPKQSLVAPAVNDFWKCRQS